MTYDPCGDCRGRAVGRGLQRLCITFRRTRSQGKSGTGTYAVAMDDNQPGRHKPSPVVPQGPPPGLDPGEAADLEEHEEGDSDARSHASGVVSQQDDGQGSEGDWDSIKSDEGKGEHGT